MPDPLGVGLLHGGLLHVFAFGEDLFHSCYVVSTNCWQANIAPERPAWRWRQNGKKPSKEEKDIIQKCLHYFVLVFLQIIYYYIFLQEKTLTTGKWKLHRWQCPSRFPLSEWKCHVQHWRQSWAQTWSRPAWLSGRRSISSAEYAALRGHPNGKRFYQYVVWRKKLFFQKSTTFQLQGNFFNVTVTIKEDIFQQLVKTIEMIITDTANSTASTTTHNILNNSKVEYSKRIKLIKAC